VKVQEEVWAQREVPAGNWRRLTPQEREGAWAQMREDAARIAAADGKVLTDTPGARHVLYQRTVNDDEYLFSRLAECGEAEADVVRLRLSCWAAEQ
jgi:hypothetical protein